MADAVLFVVLVLAMSVTPGLSPGESKGGASAVVNSGKSDAASFYDLTVTDIDGQEVRLARYRGQVCLVVNVASR